MNVNPQEKPFMEAEKWCRIIQKLKKGYKIALCPKIQKRLSWDWYRAHCGLRKANREIMAMADQVSYAEMVSFLESQKIRI